MTDKQKQIKKLEAEGFGLTTTLTALLMGYQHHTLEGSKEALRITKRLSTLKTKIERLEA